MFMTFAVGTGRCGSTMLSRLLALHPDVLSLSEYWNMLRNGPNLPNYEISGADFWQQLARDFTDFDALTRIGIKSDEDFYPYDRSRFDVVTGVPGICRLLAGITDDPDDLYDKLAPIVLSWPRRPALEHSRALFAELAAIADRPAVVERTAGSLAFMPDLRVHFPEARYVFLHRSGPETALSMIRHPQFRLDTFKRLAAVVGSPDAAEIPLSHEVSGKGPEDFAGLTGPPFDKDRFLTFPLSMKDFGWLWSTTIRAGTSELGKIPHDEWIIMRYEQLLINPRAELMRLAEFLEVPIREQWLEKACALVDPGRSRPAKSRLHPSALAELRNICAPGTRAFELLEAEHAAAANALS